MFDRLDDILIRFEELLHELGDPVLTSDSEKFRRLMKEQAELAPLVETYTQYKKTKKSIEENLELLEQERDEEMRELLKEDLAEAKKQMPELEKELKLLLLPKDPNDEKNVFVEIRAGAGGDGDSAMNAANILKPALANGQIQLIGTTTIKEYRKYIEKDTALERRFQQVLIEEPTVDDSIGILDGIKKYYEDYHKVKISTDVIKQTVIMSEKYIHDRFLPDKAIDILDEACSRINLENKDLYKLELLRQKLKEVQDQKDEAVTTDSTEDYQKAANLKTEECRLMEEIDKINSSMKIQNLTVQDIANVIESWTKIPVSKITEEETQKNNWSRRSCKCS